MSDYKLAETKNFIKSINSDLNKKKHYEEIKSKIYPILKENPFKLENVKQLKGNFKGVLHFRMGNYRLFYVVDTDKRIVIILDFIHRKDAYR